MDKTSQVAIAKVCVIFRKKDEMMPAFVDRRRWRHWLVAFRAQIQEPFRVVK